jgi:PAS domain S-box-containing protein
MNVLKDISFGGWSDILFRFFRIFLPLAVFFGSLTVLFYYKDVNTELLSVKKDEYFKISSQVEAINSRFESINTDLQFLVAQNELLQYLKNSNPDQLATLIQELELFASIKKIYTQVKFLDKNSDNIIRVFNEEDMSGSANMSSLAEGIQQDYYTSSERFPENRVYISPINFTDKSNSKGKAAPVIHFSIPVIDTRDDLRGVFVLSHPVTFLLEDMQSASQHSRGQSYLINDNGDYFGGQSIKENDLQQQDTSPKKIEDLLGDDAWQQIRQQQRGQISTPLGLITFSTIYPLQADRAAKKSEPAKTLNNADQEYLWKAVSFVPKKVLKEWPEKILGRILLLYSVCVIIIAISSFMLARTGLRRKKAEEAMRENEEELRAINEAAANAIIAIDNNKNVLHWNPAAERLFQYSAKEVVDKPITSIISPPKHQSSFTKISRKFKLPVDTDSMEAKTIELYGYKKDGTEFPVEVSFSAFKKGDQWHTVGIIRDITARKMMEKEVLRANKFESLGVLSTGIAHDFNNLLTAIIGNINLVRKLSGIPSDSIELLKNAEKASRRAKALTQQLLTFSKEGLPIRKTTDITKLVYDAVEFTLHGSTIVSSIDIAEDLLLVDIDAGQIGQVIQNLVTNSRQAIKGNGVIHISCRNVMAEDTAKIPAHLSGNYIAITIRDNGQGIAERDQSKIFDPYFTTKESGSGLGLTIAHSIIQRHDGHITVESEENKGACFIVYLPAAVDQHLPKEAEKKRGKGKSFKIMVVDSEEMLLNIAGRMLVHLGHECVCAKSAREALDTYKHLWKTGSPVDGVIVDLTLPGGMGGKETAAAIFDINSEARIIVSSGYANDPVMVDFDEYGFCAAIAKPFEMDELAEVIETVLE